MFTLSRPFDVRKYFSNWIQSISTSTIKNPWQFSSKRIDEESGLIYYGGRYYDPSLSRWLTCDPMKFVDGLNLYAFVQNDPLIKFDLYGLETYNTIDLGKSSLDGFVQGGSSHPLDTYSQYVNYEIEFGKAVYFNNYSYFSSV